MGSDSPPSITNQGNSLQTWPQASPSETVLQLKSPHSQVFRVSHEIDHHWLSHSLCPVGSSWKREFQVPPTHVNNTAPSTVSTHNKQDKPTGCL